MTMPIQTEPLQSRVADGLYNDILAGILLGEYPPQSTLPPETRLAEDYGISRTVVRTALEQLKRDGLVQSRQGSGTVVADCCPRKMAELNRDAQLAQFRQCLACRLAVEPEIAAAIAESGSSEARAYLQSDAVRLEAGASERGQGYRAAQDIAFHIRLAELSGNVFFASIMTSLRPHILFAMNVVKAMRPVDLTRHVCASEQEHEAVARAILARDPDRARIAMRGHLENARRRMLGAEPGVSGG